MAENGRICTRCKTWKSEEFFYQRRDKPGYLVGVCRQCTSTANKASPPSPRICATCRTEYQPKRRGRRPVYCSQRCGAIARTLDRTQPKPPRAILVVDDHKRCNNCLEWKPLSSFGLRKDRKSTPLSECRRCGAARALKYSRSERGRDVRYAYVYGVSIDWYEAKLSEQNGQCAICRRPPDGNDPKHPRLVIDHCHESGDARGLLCFRCNLMLGLSTDDVAVLRGAIDYLEGLARANDLPSRRAAVGNSVGV